MARVNRLGNESHCFFTRRNLADEERSHIPWLIWNKNSDSTEGMVFSGAMQAAGLSTFWPWTRQGFTTGHYAEAALLRRVEALKFQTGAVWQSQK